MRSACCSGEISVSARSPTRLTRTYPSHCCISGRLYACFVVHDWESVQFRLEPDGTVSERASSHHGYNFIRGPGNWASDAGFAAHDGWGQASHLLFVSGGSHAGNAFAFTGFGRFTPGRRVHLVPLEPIAADSEYEFAVSPPWQKEVWRDPEDEGTS